MTCRLSWEKGDSLESGSLMTYQSSHRTRVVYGWCTGRGIGRSE
jgi:hypothetical protein